jgi:hypothetical protein
MKGAVKLKMLEHAAADRVKVVLWGMLTMIVPTVLLVTAATGEVLLVGRGAPGGAGGKGGRGGVGDEEP